MLLCRDILLLGHGELSTGIFLAVSVIKAANTLFREQNNRTNRYKDKTKQMLSLFN